MARAYANALSGARTQFRPPRRPATRRTLLQRPPSPVKGKSERAEADWAAVSERLACSPPTKAIRVQSPAGFSEVPDDDVDRRFFSGIYRFPSPFVPALLHNHLNQPRRLSIPRCENGAASERKGEGGGKGEIPEKTRRPAASPDAIPTCENPEGPRFTVMGGEQSNRSATAAPPQNYKETLLASHQGEPGSIPGRFNTDIRKWGSCRTMPLVVGFSRGYPVSPTLHSGAAPYSTSISIIDSQYLA
ncbi:hypothetical protein PR048_022404, partial [Dryococelus australis]